MKRHSPAPSRPRPLLRRRLRTPFPALKLRERLEALGGADEGLHFGIEHGCPGADAAGEWRGAAMSATGAPLVLNASSLAPQCGETARVTGKVFETSNLRLY